MATVRYRSNESKTPLNAGSKRKVLDMAGPLPPTVRLRSGLELPRLGLGTFQLSGRACEAAVTSALSAGYRLLDTASIYKNEEVIGAALRRWEAASQGGPQGAALVTSKCSPCEMGAERAKAALDASLARLGREAIDLYLIHWPALPKKPHGSAEHRLARFKTWRALEDLHLSGKARAIGVSNFTAAHLQNLIDDGATILPMVNQIEAHPLFVPKETVDFCASHDIVIQAYAPLGGGPASNFAKAAGYDGTQTLLDHPIVASIAQELGRSPAQVLLRWGLQMGFVVIPRSTCEARIAENARIFDFELTSSQMTRLSSIKEGAEAQKFCWDPITVL
ncbi:unnamed protein product [Polarella glacialis]|uniref:NADP-dependent oxidoreductase domain-containing protein n=1 Tax=Polarella glacialis TaxID=89957 RepID=A0A813JME0_POLGL|nr:unnamed protein product [Polarella glacialis]